MIVSMMLAGIPVRRDPAAVPDVDEPRSTIGLKITGVDEVHSRLVAFRAKIKAPPRIRAWACTGSAPSIRTEYQSTSTSRRDARLPTSSSSPVADNPRLS